MKSKITSFIADIESEDSKIRQYFNKPDFLVESLRELEEFIGLDNIKDELVDQIISFIGDKAENRDTNDMHHVLLTGGPGVGKTELGKVIAKIWVGVGFLKVKETNKKSKSVSDFQNKLIREQRIEINGLKDKINAGKGYVDNVVSVCSLTKDSLGRLISQKDKMTKNVYDSVYKDMCSGCDTLEQIQQFMTQLNPKKKSYVGMGIPKEELMKDFEEPTNEVPFHVFNSYDVISRYAGDTHHRTKAALDAALGGVAYFDEAYNLCRRSPGMEDSYGSQALTIINEYMSSKKDELIVIFAGYYEDIYNNLFKVQRGLESRFTHKFDIKPYTPEQLTRILILQFKRNGFQLKLSEELEDLISENEKLFMYQGRDMGTLCLYARNIFSRLNYDKIKAGKKVSNVIDDLKIIEEAIEIFKQNMIYKNKKESDEDKLFKFIERTIQK